MLAPFHARTPRDRKVVIISVGLAIGLHIAALVWFKVERSNRAMHTPPEIGGFGKSGEVAVQAGLPMTPEMNRHRFRVLTEIDGKPVIGARVTDVLMQTEGYTGADGVAVIPVRPGAKLAAKVEKAGFAVEAAEFPNLNRDHEHTVILREQPVKYAQVDSIFIKACTYCHGAVGHSGQVVLTAYDSTMTSSAQGKPIVVKFKPDSSRLVTVLTQLTDSAGRMAKHMKQSSPPSAFDIELIAQWIREGARRK